MTYKIESDDDGCTYVTRDGDPVSAGDVLRSLVAHEELVAALEELITPWSGETAERHSAMGKARAALALAKEEKG